MENYTSSSFEKGEYILEIFIDLSKLFYIVYHEIILYIQDVATKISSRRARRRGGEGEGGVEIETFSSNDFFICKTFTSVFLRNINSKQILLTCHSN